MICLHIYKEKKVQGGGQKKKEFFTAKRFFYKTYFTFTFPNSNEQKKLTIDNV